MKLTRIIASLLLLIMSTSSLFAGAVLDVVKSDIVINQKVKRDYIPLTNIGNESGTFIVQVKNVTDPKHIITYSNSELKKLPVIISPILIRNLGAGNNKRISVRAKGKITEPMKLQLVISEYKKSADDKTEVADDAAGIDVQGSIHYIANIAIS
ncbi:MULTISPECIES: hypothetical protein [Cysteiniphilum]|uniref:hypothetical protein n=1 Tax=Cysteiniphilum TaxID=2056696 RepID=UPI0017868BBE|nr:MULTISPECIES: hypothetical protein [Cysteiniphilum]